MLFQIIFAKTFVSAGFAFERANFEVGPLDVIDDDASSVKRFRAHVTEHRGLLMRLAVLTERLAIAMLNAAVVADERAARIQNFV